MITLLDADPPDEVVTQASPPPEIAAPAPPPAAKIIVEGVRSELEIELESELQAERDRHATTAAEKKQREIRIAELEDERRALLAPPAPKKSIMERFMAGED